MSISCISSDSFDSLPTIRLLQLVSPSLPTGSFTYSQGIEWAVEAGWVSNARQLKAWLQEQIKNNLARLDLPILSRLLTACLEKDGDSLVYWTKFLIACRETSELRQEELNRGRAMLGVINSLGLLDDEHWAKTLSTSQLSGFAYAASRWHIPKSALLHGYAWSWLENLTLAGVKIIPLGQSDGQKILSDLSPQLNHAVQIADNLADDAIGAGSPALAIASSRHQFQYTRLFRS